MRGMLGRPCRYLPDARRRLCRRALYSGVSILLLIAQGFLPSRAGAERLTVDLSPDAIGQAVADHRQFLADLQEIASQQSKPTPVPFVVEILLPADSRLVDVVLPKGARVVGTGWSHGYSIGHVSLPLEQATTWQNGAQLELITEPLVQPSARLRRSLPRQALEARRTLQARVVNPSALGRYSENNLVLKSTAASAFSPTQLPTLDGSAVEMLIVTREDLSAAFEVYAQERTRFGTPTVVRTVEWIRQNYPQGADTQEMIRGFVRQAYELWGIRYVLIGGDSSVIPARFASVTIDGETELVPSDLYYACLDGSWNQDGDAAWGEGFDTNTGETDMADLYPEVFVGRLPVTSDAEIQQYLAKLQSYVDPQLQDFQGRMLFMGEVIWPANYIPNNPIFKNGADNIERLITLSGLQGSGVALTKLYETPEFYTAADQLTRLRAQQEMDSGYGLVTHVGHGFRYTMSLGDASLTNVQANLLSNTQRPFFLNMLNCTATAFDFPCLAERFVLNANGGAVGVIGASREASPDNVQLYQEAWFSTLFRDVQVSGAQALHEARLRYLSQTFSEGAFRWTNYILSYLGDPKIDIWRGSPTEITVSHPASIALGEQQMTVNVQSVSGPVVDAVVCLWKQGDFYALAQTNASGNVFVNIRPETLGDIAVTVCGGGTLPYEGSINVLGVAGASLHATGNLVIDDAGPGTIGNGNGLLEAGETAFLQIELANEGAAAAQLTTILAQTSDPFLVVPQPLLDLGTVAAGTTILSPPLEVRMNSASLDQYHVDVSLVIQADGWSWNDVVQLDLLQVQPELVGMTPNFSGEFPVAGEAYDLFVQVKNYGFAQLDAATASIYSADPDITILVGSDALGDIGHLSTATARFRLREWNTIDDNDLVVVVLSGDGRLWSFPVKTRRPQSPSNLSLDPSGGPSVVKLQWDASSSADVGGYRVYRALHPSGPWSAVSDDWITSTTSFRDDGLTGSTDYSYRVVTLDESGNESLPTEVVSTTTNPTQNDGWPRLMGQWTSAPPVAVDLDGDLVPEILSGSDRMYAWHANGEELQDGDANAATNGVWNTHGYSFVAGLAAADLTGDGSNEVVACSWDTKEVYVFNGDGTVVNGWPQSMAVSTHGIWATPALEDLDLDGELEIIMLGLDGRVYVWHADGTELVDGDNDPLTTGVFFNIPSGGAWSRGAPVVANIVTTDATPEIVFGARNGNIYMLKSDGTVAPGWPRTTGNEVNSAPSLGDIDGNGTLDIVVPSTDGYLYVLNGDASDLTGWPVAFETHWIALTPSVALHDFDDNGTLELVVGGSTGGTFEGELYMFDATGNVVPGWPVNVHSASEASPIIGDVDGDAVPEILYGGESGVLYGYRPDGTIAPGFPIQLGAEVRATPLLTDVDLDGDVDLLFAGWDQQVYVFDFPGAYIRSNVPWGGFKNNARRNGVYQWHLPTDVGEDPSVNAAPAATRLLPNVPNPFNPRTTLSFELAGSHAQRVRLFVYDANGRLVRRLLNRKMSPGPHREIWNGTDEAGRSMASGVYFYQLDTPDHRSSRKMILLR